MLFHGPEFVSQYLGGLAAGKNGLSSHTLSQFGSRGSVFHEPHDTQVSVGNRNALRLLEPY